MKLKKFSDFILERNSSDVLKNKRGWVAFDKRLLDDEFSEEILDLINIAYKPIGGHAKMRNINDVLNGKYDYWKIIDLDNDNKANIVIFGKKTRYGIKYAGVGHDGSKLAKRTYISAKIDTHSEFGGGHYTEVSDKIADIMIKSNVPTITDPDVITMVLGKPIKYFGEHPKGKQGYGWYSRKIGGHEHYKLLIGSPKNVPMRSR